MGRHQRRHKIRYAISQQKTLALAICATIFLIPSGGWHVLSGSRFAHVERDGI
jgi:hypothetical protein